MDLGEDGTPANADQMRSCWKLMVTWHWRQLRVRYGFIERWGGELLNNPVNQIPGDRMLHFTGHLILQKPLTFQPVWLEFFELGWINFPS